MPRTEKIHRPRSQRPPRGVTFPNCRRAAYPAAPSAYHPLETPVPHARDGRPFLLRVGRGTFRDERESTSFERNERHDSWRSLCVLEYAADGRRSFDQTETVPLRVACVRRRSGCNNVRGGWFLSFSIRL